MIDVVPLPSGQWLARCECGATDHFPTAEAGWSWVLAHPCPEPDAEPAPRVVDLNQTTSCHRD